MSSISKSKILPVYNPSSISFVRGENSFLFDSNGKKYIDFAAGIAVNSLGYSHPKLVNVMKEYLVKPWHISNMYTIPEAENLARLLVEKTFADGAFFINSGSEAVENCLKIMRAFHSKRGDLKRKHIISFSSGFHGRTYGSLSASDSPKIPELSPYVGEISSLPFNNCDALQSVDNETLAGFIVEPIQCEGGVRYASKNFLRTLRSICDKSGALLCFDEVQCGIGRTGYILASQEFEVEPDLCAIGKGMGGGIPIGACLANKKTIEYIFKKLLGSTYGNNPLCTAISFAVIETISDPKFLEEVRRKGKLFKDILDSTMKTFSDIILDVRGSGLLFGIQLNEDMVGKEKLISHKLLEKGLAIVPGRNGVLRITPPLTINDQEIEEGVEILRDFFRKNN